MSAEPHRGNRYEGALRRLRPRTAIDAAPTLWHALAATVRRRPHETAIVRGSQRITFGRLWHDSRRWAATLAHYGVKRGDRVLLWDEGSETFAAPLFAAWRLGAIPVPLDVRSAAAHVHHALALVEPKVIVCSGGAALLYTNSAPVLTAAECGHLRNLGAAHVSSPPLPADPALIVFTSGSTGRPKAVVHCHGPLLRCHQRLAVLFDVQPWDRSLCPLPWAYTFALRLLWMTALVGSSVVLPETLNFMDICAAVRRHRPTCFAAIPPSYKVLLQGLAPLRQVDLSSVRILLSSGSAISSTLMAEIESGFSNGRLFITYGLTETQPSTLVDPADVGKHPASVGRAIPGVGIAIVDESGKPVGPGETGEIVVRSDQLCAEYWRDPEATARLLRPDPFGPVELVNSPPAAFTGDLGFLDENGTLHLKGRRDQMLKPLGVRVSPQEIEDLLDRSGLVREVGVVGRPHEVFGDEIFAFVVAAQAAPDFRARLLKYARETMSPYMIPKRVIVSEALPRTRTGKIDYHALAAEAARMSPGIGGMRATS